MGSKERIQRQKEETRSNILEAALEIVKEDGWQALSMRKIADKIEYTAPIIYEYFENKEGILLELTRQGNQLLLKDFLAARAAHTDPDKQLRAMWTAYWEFAFAHKEMYQLMFGVDMNCCVTKQIPEAEAARQLVIDAIVSLMDDKSPAKELVCRKYYTFWSVIHGLISINLVRKCTNDEKMNRQILDDAINGIIKYIND